MATASGEVVDLRPLGSVLGTMSTRSLLKTQAIEVLRLIVLKGKELPAHRAPGEMTIYCLEGSVEFKIGEKTFELTAGQLLHLIDGEPHAVKGIEDSSLLLTIVSSKNNPSARVDVVEEASEESFPASDPPARYVAERE